MSEPYDVSIILLHDQMIDKQGTLVTTSLTLIDLHDIARSSRTYGLRNFYIAHSAPAMRKLAGMVQSHWMEGFGATYNPKRHEAIRTVEVVERLDDAVSAIQTRTGRAPTLVATSAKDGMDRVRFSELRATIHASEDPYLIMLGTGWGMSEELLGRAQLFLEPVRGLPQFNHLSVRSAAAIILDRLLGIHA